MKDRYYFIVAYLQMTTLMHKTQQLHIKRKPMKEFSQQNNYKGRREGVCRGGV